MTSFGKYLIIAAFFLLAMVCYFVGSKLGALAFIALGVLLEIAAWVGVFKTTNKHS